MSWRALPARLQPNVNVATTLKRAFDLFASTLALVLLLPIFAIVAVAIKLESSGPIFFCQKRIGRGERPFLIFKFRSMTIDAERAGTALTVRADKRITRVGSFLRKSKIDELPQLINVLAGHMSLVGPRPEVPQFMQFYTAEQRALVTSMRPGLTDYAAILFHDEAALLDGEQDPVGVYRREIMPIKYACYERYSRELSVANDVRIMLATIMLLVFGRVPRWLGIEQKLQNPPRQKDGTETGFVLNEGIQDR